MLIKKFDGDKYIPVFGKRISNTKELQSEIRRRGLIEVGDAKPETINKSIANSKKQDDVYKEKQFEKKKQEYAGKL